MATVTVHAAKTQLSKLIRQVEAGEEVVIARGGKPVVRLVALAAEKPRRQPGVLKGKIHVTDAFFEPLPEDEMRYWEGEEEDF